MLALLQALGFILLTWCVVGAVFTGIGALARSILFGVSPRRGGDVFSSFWIGWAITIVYAQLWQLFFPIDMWAWAIPVALAGYGLCRCGQGTGAIIWAGVTHRPMTALFLVLVALWTANHAMAPLINYDAGLYHLATIRWENSYPIIPGLGNLHGRLAFNSSAYLYMALLNVGPWIGKAHSLANSLLLVVLLAEEVISLTRILRPREGSQAAPTDVVLALLTLPTVLFALTLGGGVAGTSNDMIVFILQVIVSIQVLQLLATRDMSTTDRRMCLFTIILLAAMGVLVKLSFGAFGLTAISIAIAAFIRLQPSERRSWSIPFVLSLTVMICAILPWAVRGIILSGYPAYPNTWLSVPVDWRVPTSHAIAEGNSIIGWARFPGLTWQESLGNWHWIQPWFVSNQRDFMPPLLVTLIVVALTPVFSRTGANPRKALWLFLVPSVVGIAAWLATAPDPRFAGALFWLLATGSIALTVFSRVRQVQLVTAVLLLAVIIAQSNPALGVAALPVAPGPNGGFYNIPVTALHTITVSKELTLYVPVSGEQTWDAPLPSAPAPPTHLYLRCSQTLLCGFRTKS